MKKLPIDHKFFWKEFISFILAFFAASFIFGYNPESKQFSFLDGYIYISFLCVIYLGYKIAEHSAEDEGDKADADDVLTDKRIINFLRYIKIHNLHDGVGDIDFICSELDNGKSVEEIFKRGKDGHGYSIMATGIPGIAFRITFRWEEQCGGDGGEWRVEFDEKNNVIECTLGERWFDN